MFALVFFKQTVEFNCLFQKERGKTASLARILSPNPMRRPLPYLLIQSFFYAALPLSRIAHMYCTVYCYHARCSEKSKVTLKIILRNLTILLNLFAARDTLPFRKKRAVSSTRRGRKPQTAVHSLYTPCTVYTVYNEDEASLVHCDPSWVPSYQRVSNKHFSNPLFWRKEEDKNCLKWQISY